MNCKTEKKSEEIEIGHETADVELEGQINIFIWPVSIYLAQVHSFKQDAYKQPFDGCS